MLESSFPSSSSPAPVLHRRERCPGCGHGAARTLYREPLDSPGIRRYMQEHYERRVERDFSGYDYELAQCEHFGLVYQAQVPTPDLLQEIYDRWLPATEREAVVARRGLDDYRYLAGQVEFMLDHFRLRPSSIRALDFGFGWAEWGKMAGAFGVNCAAPSCPRCGSTMRSRSAFRSSTPTSCRTGSFKPGEMLRRPGRAMRPGGLVKVSVPNSAKLYNSSSGWMEPKSALKTLARPAYRHLYPKSTFVYFARPA